MQSRLGRVCHRGRPRASAALRSDLRYHTRRKMSPAARKLHVLQVIDSLGMGGAETWLMALLRRWSETKEARIDFLVTSGRRGIFDDEARSLGARLHYLRY